MDSYWDSVWTGEKIKDYKKYINFNYDYKFIDIFKQNDVFNICDAACGFGKYSAILSKSGLSVSGFDILEEAVILTKGMLNEFNLKYNDYCVCSITDIRFQNQCFDGLEEDDIKISHEVLDDGSFKYIDDLRKGMIFKYYTDEEIKKLIKGKEILYFNKSQSGVREVILRKE